MRALLDAAGLAYEVDPTLVRGLDYYTRTVFEFTSDALGAQSRRRRRRALRRADRADRRAADARHAAGRPASSGSCWPAAARRRPRRRSTSTSPTPGPSCAPRRSGSPPTRAARATRARLELAGRSLKGQLKQADRAGARYVAILGDEGTSLKDMETGEQQTVEPDTVMHHIARGPL